MQFEGLTNSIMLATMWKPWATPKCKIITWLVLQNRVWTTDRLERRGWQNCGNCKLCNQTQESFTRLLFTCRFTKRFQSSNKEWFGVIYVNQEVWHEAEMVEDWWRSFVQKKGQSKRVMSSLAMFVSWEI
jgi:hypothetical protein